MSFKTSILFLTIVASLPAKEETVLNDTPNVFLLFERKCVYFANSELIKPLQVSVSKSDFSFAEELRQEFGPKRHDCSLTHLLNSIFYNMILT